MRGLKLTPRDPLRCELRRPRKRSASADGWGSQLAERERGRLRGCDGVRNAARTGHCAGASSDCRAAGSLLASATSPMTCIRCRQIRLTST
mmetsp:Transcript_155009/g.496848  ORF Transcript_155009/g.496848 Transcript_155009/m.496848 type:complete len:91 (+) Transcript_155009:855-1127(+)